jgi:protein-L-isoaspartate(D-aspartate) O-methyltransferase
MVKEQLISNGISDPRVIEAMRRIPRHLFLDSELGPQAYTNHAFPIGFSQTMSQPYMVAYLAEKLALQGGETILEIGTGSGYQAAVLAQLAGRVFTIERIEELGIRAKTVLGDLGISNVELNIGDGSTGWAEFGPFDRILTTAAATEVPESLLFQLRDGGFFLGPVFKNSGGEQEIVRLTRKGRKFKLDRLRECTFVPLVRDGREHPDNTKNGGTES